MRMDIKLFKLLNDICTENGISQEKWGEASGIPQPRISELLRQAKGKNKPNNSRYFTLTRYLGLYRGLQSIIGGGALKKALMNKVEAESDPKVRLWAKLATLIEAEEEAERQKVVQLEQFIDLLTK